jgi:hypothetical protein
LLVYENDGSENGTWLQFKSAPASCTTSQPGILAPGESCVLRFKSKVECDGKNDVPAKVPLGRHLLVLTVDGKLPGGSERRVTQVDFHPGVHLPPVVWEFR